MLRPGSVALLLLATVLTQSGKSWSSNGAPPNQSNSSHLASVKTYAPGNFQQSRLDRWSGGLSHWFPYRMVADSQGRVLVTDPGLSVVHVFDTRQGTRWQIRGDVHHLLRWPAYIAVDADNNIYVTDFGLLAVLVFQPNGRYLRTIGSEVLNVPTGIWVDKSSQTLYVADWWSSKILWFDLEGELLGEIGTYGRGPGQLNEPSDIAIDHDTLVVLNSANSRFELFDLQGNSRGTWPFGVDRTPIAFAFDGEGNLFYVDLESGALEAMDPRGKVFARFGPVRRSGQLRPKGLPFRCVAKDAFGNILVLHPTLDIETVKLLPGDSESAP